MTATLRASFVSFLLFAFPVAAQSTRAEEIATRQAEKSTALGSETEGRAEQIIGRLALAGDPHGFYPFFASPFPGGGLSAGVGYQHHLPRGARTGVGLSWSIQNFKLVQGHFGLPLDRDNRFYVDLRGRWIDAPGVAFYGLGPDTSRIDRVDFGYRPSSAAASLTARPVRFLQLTAAYSLVDAATTDDSETLSRFTPDAAPGIGAALRYHVAFAGIALDTRPSPSYSDHGSLIRVDWSRFREREDKPYSFDRTEVELSQLVPLVGRHFVLAFRALGTTTQPIDGGTVPFMLAPHVGSGSTVRGFHNRRFQDRHRLLLNGEYRWQASRYLNMALFYDLGQVQPDTDRFRWKAFEKGWGIGARFHTPTASVLRLELARSREGWVVVAGANQPF
ncbi:MAG: BamA/TamA family outer membrane protein [Acidobacteria bacterium]|nr:BamA/TamA family outer membrane protein [Acidobacteriota bacterium]